MNVNAEIIKTLGDATQLPVAFEVYEGNAEKFIVFNYQNEKSDGWADNHASVEVAYMTVQLITPKSFNYMNLKHIIRDALNSLDNYSVINIESILGDVYQGTENTRQTIFTVEIFNSI